MFRKNRNNEGMFANEAAIRELTNTFSSTHGKRLCLDVGAGAVKDANFTSVDISEEHSPDIICDIRSFFEPDNDDLKDNPGAISLMTRQFMLIRMNHIVEHIEWIYQKRLFDWAYKKLLPGGMLSVATPNLQFIMGVYVKNRKRQLAGKELKYPVQEHPYLSEGIPSDLQWWVNFKLFSGCSPGDYHHCAYDRQSLYSMMAYSSFSSIRIFDGRTMSAVAFKDMGDNESVIGDVIKRTVDG